MKNIAMMAVAVMGLSPASATATDTVLNRTESLINTFQFMCGRELDFKIIDAQATVMRMSLQGDASTVEVPGTTTHRKTWLGSSTYGPYGLVVDETKGSKGTLTSCAVFGEVADTEVFRTTFKKALGLGPSGEPRLEAGANGYEWMTYAGPGTTLILRDLTPSGKSAVEMKLLAMNTAAH